MMGDPRLPSSLLCYVARRGTPLPADATSPPPEGFLPYGPVKGAGLAKLFAPPPVPVELRLTVDSPRLQVDSKDFTVERADDPDGVWNSSAWAAARSNQGAWVCVSLLFDALSDDGDIGRLVVPSVKIVVVDERTVDVVACPADGWLAQAFLLSGEPRDAPVR